MKWNEGNKDGGTSVIDYKIGYTIGNDPYVILETSITTLSFVVENLIAGIKYKFKI